MSNQKNILLVTNSTTDNEIGLIKDAFNHAEHRGLNINLHLVNVIPNLPTCYFNIPSMVLLAERYYEEAMTSLLHMGEMLNVAKKNQWLITGRVKTEVLSLASKLDISFILASSSSIQDLHKSFLFARKMRRNTPIRSISSLVTI